MRTISASRREDMPAFRMNELMEKYKSMGDDAFWVLWTKNPHLLVNSGMDFRRVALQLTVTGLGGTDWEPRVPSPERVVDDVAALINKGFNPDLINWRFDPIVRGNAVDTIEKLAPMMAKLNIRRCITSFVTFYGVLKQRWADWEQSQFPEQEQTQIIKHIKGVLGRHGIELFGCAQPHLDGLILPSACIDGEYYQGITGFDLIGDKDKYQRKHCHCTASYDIGKYRKCAHACVYCYSRENQEKDSDPSEIDFDEV